MDTWIGEQVASRQLADRSVLDVGSYDVNGSNRHHFTGPYMGIDIRNGPNVDRTYDGLHLPFASNSFDVIVSTEMLEHCARFWDVCAEMVRVARDIVLVTTRGVMYTQHNEPDRWRFMPGALSELFTDLGCAATEIEDPQSSGVFVAATPTK